MDPRDVQELRRGAGAVLRSKRAKGKEPMMEPPQASAAYVQPRSEVARSYEVRGSGPPNRITSGSVASDRSPVPNPRDRVQTLLGTCDSFFSVESGAERPEDEACRTVLEAVGRLIHYMEASDSAQGVAQSLEARVEEVEDLLEGARSEAAVAKIALENETERAEVLSAQIRKSAFKVGAGKEAVKKARRERDEASRSVQRDLDDAERIHQAEVATLREQMRKDKESADSHKKWLQERYADLLRANRDLEAEADGIRLERDQARARVHALENAPDARENKRLGDLVYKLNSENSVLRQKVFQLTDRLRASEASTLEKLKDNMALARLYTHQTERFKVFESQVELQGTALTQVHEELRETRRNQDCLWGKAYHQGFEECRTIASALCPERARDFLQVPMNAAPLASVDPERVGDPSQVPMNVAPPSSVDSDVEILERDPRGR